MKKYNYVYCTTNKINGKFYIGKHSTNNLNDGYLGSGKLLQKAIKKYGKENFSKRIIKMCETEHEAYQIEKFLVTNYIISRDDCYNLVTGGRGEGSGPKENYIPWNKGKHISDDHKKHISEYQKTHKHIMTEQEKENRHKAAILREAAKKARGYKYQGNHHKHSEETKRKIGDAHRCKQLSEETKKKMSDASKNRKRDKNGKFTKK